MFLLVATIMDRQGIVFGRTHKIAVNDRRRNDCLQYEWLDEPQALSLWGPGKGMSSAHRILVSGT